MALTLKHGKGVYLGSLTITVASDDDASDIMTADVYGNFSAISIISDGTAQVGTITLAALRHYTLDETNDANWATIQSPPGTDVTIAADKAIALTALPFAAIRLESSGTETSDQVYYVYGHRGTAAN